MLSGLIMFEAVTIILGMKSTWMWLDEFIATGQFTWRTLVALAACAGCASIFVFSMREAGFFDRYTPVEASRFLCFIPLLFMGFAPVGFIELIGWVMNQYGYGIFQSILAILASTLVVGLPLGLVGMTILKRIECRPSENEASHRVTSERATVNVMDRQSRECKECSRCTAPFLLRLFFFWPFWAVRWVVTLFGWLAHRCPDCGHRISDHDNFKNFKPQR